MYYQLQWKTLPGLRGLSCSEFRAEPTAQPDPERGVAIELASEAERDALVRALEQQFAAQRFSNTAAAFEAVKSCVLDWVARRGAEGQQHRNS
ncbi:MAG: hypothetical protein K6U09_00510 [Acidobacteriia bacterium]|jgi:hypothetical protein|nr:hypothetical protein [Terriglobia bacterium]